MLKTKAPLKKKFEKFSIELAVGKKVTNPLPKKTTKAVGIKKEVKTFSWFLENKSISRYQMIYMLVNFFVVKCNINIF